jgi:hypothetical protein
MRVKYQIVYFIHFHETAETAVSSQTGTCTNPEALGRSSRSSRQDEVWRFHQDRSGVAPRMVGGAPLNHEDVNPFRGFFGMT